jgi:hypothetical protein
VVQPAHDQDPIVGPKRINERLCHVFLSQLVASDEIGLPFGIGRKLPFEPFTVVIFWAAMLTPKIHWHLNFEIPSAAGFRDTLKNTGLGIPNLLTHERDFRGLHCLADFRFQVLLLTRMQFGLAEYERDVRKL